MKVLHIGKYYPPVHGGIERFVSDLAQEQIRSGHDVMVLCFHSEKGLPTSSTILNNVTVRRVRIQVHTGFIPVAFDFGKELRKAVLSFQPDILHLHFPNPIAFLHSLIPKNIPWVVHWHADVRDAQGVSIRLGYPLYSIFETAVLRQAASIIVTSDAYLAGSHTLHPYLTKCHVVPLGLNPERLRNYAPVKGSGDTVLSVGRLALYKGFEYLIEAASLVPHAKFQIVGSGPLHTQLENDIRLRGLEHQVELLGPLPDGELHELMARADVFCLPSIHRSEAFGVVLLEAMCFRTPLVSTSIFGSGTGWVNQDGETGYVVPPKDVTALARALHRLLDDTDQRNHMGAAAQQRFKDHFQINRIADLIDNVYRSVLVG